MRHLFFFVSVLVVSACASSGDGVGKQGVGDGDGQAGQFLGTRQLPGASVTVHALDPLVPGSEARFQVSIDTSPSSLQVLLGADYQTALACSLVADGERTWIASVQLPDPRPEGSAVLVRLTFADGSVEESALSDFRW